MSGIVFAMIAIGMSLFNRIFSNILNKVGSKFIGRYEVTFLGGSLGFEISIISENF